MAGADSLAQRRAQLNAHQRELLMRRMQGSAPAMSGATIPRRGATTAPLSSAQKRLWFLWQLNGSDPAYHLSGVLKLAGDLNADALQSALDAVVARHEALRTVFRMDAEGIPTQHIQPHLPLALTQLNLCDIHVDQRTTHAQRAVHEFHEIPFDLTRGPLLRAQWIRLDAHEHWLAVVMHHIVTDAWSKRIIIGELVACYNAHVEGRACELPPVPLQYADYAHWQEQWCASPERSRQLAYWRDQLGDVDSSTQLPADRPHEGGGKRHGVTHHLSLPSAQALASFAQAQKTSLFSVLLAGLLMVLQRYTRQRDLCIGVPIANRHHMETAETVGFFVNTQAWRLEIGPLATARSIVAQVHDKALGAQANQDLPFDQLVDSLQSGANTARTPLFSVMFNHLKEDHTQLLRLQGLELREYMNLSKGAQFDLSIDTTEHADGKLAAAFTFDAELFAPATIARLAHHFKRALGHLIAQPDAPLHRFALLDSYECEQLTQWGNNLQADDRYEPVHRSIERQAHAHPEDVALRFGDATLSYGELNRRANRLAHHLMSLGVRAESVVGIATERSFDMVVGLLAILKAGGAYVPLDTEYPAERLAHMIEDSGIGWLLTQRHLLTALPRSESMRVLTLDDVDLRDAAEHDPQVAVHEDSLAYVIYTSGSTGKPKGAANRHRSLYNRLQWMQEAYALSRTDVVLQKTPFSFDVSVWEFFWPLLTGATLAVAAPRSHRDPGQLIEIIRRHHVTTLHFVPSMLQAFLAHPGVESCQSVTRIVCSGEALPAEVQRQALRRLPNAALYNLYGPTEAAIDVTHWTCRDDGRNHVPIGSPITGIRTCVLDGQLNLVPAGVPGELYLGGIGLARGYFRSAVLTAERFIADPLGDNGERLYRTGDLVRWNDAGALEYLGRIDSQVKIRGFRIELGEIEAHLLAQPEVREAVVVASYGAGDARLVAYFSMHAGQSIEADALRERLQRVLPEYMVPSAWVLLSALPLNANGKIDRKALPAPDFAHSSRSYEPPQGELETQLAQIWAQVLKVDRVGRHDSFFELGGHSLLATQVIARAQTALNVVITVQDIFQHTTLAALAARASATHTNSTDGALAEIDRLIDSLESA